MIDPLLLVFGPGACATIAATLLPLGLYLRYRFRRRAHRHNRLCCCGRCATPLLNDPEPEFYLVEGVYVCPRCAHGLRRRFQILLPTLGGVVLLGLLSTGLGASLGGQSITWWLNSRLIPLLLPRVGLGLGLGSAIRVMKWLNRRALAQSDRPGNPPSLSGRPSPATLPPSGSAAAESQALGRQPFRWRLTTA